MVYAGIAQLVEHNLAKVGVASSSLVPAPKYECVPESFFFKKQMAGWQSGYAAACKAVDAGSIPTPAYYCPGGGIGRRKGLKIPRDLILCRFDSGLGHEFKVSVHGVRLCVNAQREPLLQAGYYSL